MIWCNKDKYNFISKLLKTNMQKEEQYLKNLVEKEELDETTLKLVNEFFEIKNNFDLQEFVKKQDFFEFDFTDDLLSQDFSTNKENVAYAIIEAILSSR